MDKINNPMFLFVEHPKGFRIDIQIDFTGTSSLTENETIARVARIETSIGKNGTRMLTDSFNLMFDTYGMLLTVIRERFSVSETLGQFDFLCKEDVDIALKMLSKSEEAHNAFIDVFEEDDALTVH